MVPTMKHPELLALDKEFIWAFLANYDAYGDVHCYKAKQFGEGIATALPAYLQYCVDHDLLKAATDTAFFEAIETMEDLDDSRLRKLLEKQNLSRQYNDLQCTSGRNN